MKTRFGIFTWSYQCKLCQHTVCSGCLTKVSGELEAEVIMSPSFVMIA